MARIRSLKPEFFTSEPVGRLPFAARLLFQGLWTEADDKGRLKDRPAALKGALFPYDADVTPASVADYISMMEDQRLVRRYSVDGTAYIVITNFEEHQKPNRPTPSRLPDPPEQPQCKAHGGLSEDAVRTHGGLTEGSLPEGSSSSSGVVEEKTLARPPTNGTVVDLPKRSRTRLSPSESERYFEEFWQEYPRKVGKRAAAKAWDNAMRVTGPVTIRAALRAALPELRKKDPQYIPHPTTWLNQGRWEDETTAGATSAPTARCFTCRKDVAKGGGCTQGEANLEYCDRKDWVTHGQVHRVPHVDGA